MPQHEELNALDNLNAALKSLQGETCTDWTKLPDIDGACRHWLHVRNALATASMNAPEPLGYSGDRNEDDEFLNPPYIEAAE